MYRASSEQGNSNGTLRLAKPRMGLFGLPLQLAVESDAAHSTSASVPSNTSPSMWATDLPTQLRILSQKASYPRALSYKVVERPAMSLRHPFDRKDG